MDNSNSSCTVKQQLLSILLGIGRFALLAGSFFLIELVAYVLFKPPMALGLAFGAFWALILGSIVFVLPRKASQIVFGILYYTFLLWTLAQVGYCTVFNKLMWVSTIFYAGEGVTFLGDVISGFPGQMWVLGILLIALGVVILRWYPKTAAGVLPRLALLVPVVGGIVGLCLTPLYYQVLDNDIWGTHSEFGRSSSYEATYETMYDSKSVYEICGIYQLTFRDLWLNCIYPLTPGYQIAMNEQIEEVSEYFDSRGESGDNEMTGIFEGKNVVLVLMESMDDWLITETDTPTLTRLMEEGINFTDFYTPGYGSARTLNSEFCMNTGIYLPTTGDYVFDYVGNSFNQSIASQMTDNGYSAEVFHYNDPDFYSRGVFEPVMGYNKYNCYADYETDKNRLYDDCLLFDIPQLNDIFFREGQSFNTIITRSAHLSYVYNEVLSHYALKQYPEYRGMYASQEEDCARVKAKLVDDMFARLLAELESKGQLENTVIIGMTDHYTYGYKNLEELYAHSGATEETALLLEKTPCFIWSADGPSLQVDKTLCTADLVPTVLNLMGFDSPYDYLGQDAFDPNYTGYAIFPDGSWISDGVVCVAGSVGDTRILLNEKDKELTLEYLDEMADTVQEFIHVNNLLLTCDYYKDTH